MASHKRTHHNLSPSSESSNSGTILHGSTTSSPKSTSEPQTPSFLPETPSNDGVPVTRSIGGFPADEIQQQFILAVAWRSGKLGAAYYDTRCRELHVVADIPENSTDCRILRALFVQVNPKSLIIKLKQDEDRMLVINQLVGIESNPSVPRNDLQNDTESHETFSDIEDSVNLTAGAKCRLYQLPSSYFNLEAAKRKLLSLRLSHQSDNMSETERIMFLKSTFPLDYPAVIQATGALLRVLDQWKRGQDVEHLLDWGEQNSHMVTAIRVERLGDLIWMHQSAFLDLQIFSEETHPATFKKGQSTSSKEGLSLFSIMSKCHSSPGYVCLRNIFLRPTHNIQVLKQRYALIRFCIQSVNMEVVSSMVTSLRHINNVKVILAKLSIMQGSVNEWKKLMTTLQHLVALSEICASLPQDIDLFRQLAKCRNSGQLYRITKIIHRLINFEESKRAGRCIINFDNDPELDKLKRTYNNMPRVQEQVARKELDDLPQHMDMCCIEFYPEYGYCLCVEWWLPTEQVPDKTSLSIPGLQVLFWTKSNVYYKSKRCQELDETYGDLAAEITKREMRLLLMASHLIMENAEPLLLGVEMAAELDALLSMAALTSELGLVEPELIDGEIGPAQIDITNGRHILQELCIDNFVPNSTSLGGENLPRIHIITGPNSSGKSVYVMQVALIVYMAQIGCFVPATRLRLRPVTHIFTLSQVSETVAVSISQFGNELTTMSTILREAGSSSLIIMDEFGQGTSYIDGSALFISCMEHWIHKKDQSPLILTATHLHYATNHLRKNHDTASVSFMSMRYTCDKGELIFLYQPANNLCGNSFPFTVAQGAGVPGFIISRSQEILEIIQKGDNLLPLPSIWNESLARKSRKLIEDLLSIDSEDVASLKQFIRRSITVQSFGTPLVHGSP